MHDALLPIPRHAQDDTGPARPWPLAKVAQNAISRSRPSAVSSRDASVRRPPESTSPDLVRLRLARASSADDKRGGKLERRLADGHVIAERGAPNAAALVPYRPSPQHGRAVGSAAPGCPWIATLTSSAALQARVAQELASVWRFADRRARVLGVRFPSGVPKQPITPPPTVCRGSSPMLDGAAQHRESASAPRSRRRLHSSSGPPSSHHSSVSAGAPRAGKPRARAWPSSISTRLAQRRLELYRV